jgi:PhnB protein
MSERDVTVTSYLCARGAADAIEFYKRAFGAEETSERIAGENGTIGHAEFRIGSTPFYIADEYPRYRVLSPKTLGGSSVSFSMTVADADAAFKRALDAGATIERPLADEPFGRSGWLADPFGHRWNVIQPAGRTG